MSATCSVQGCLTRVESRGWCNAHYKRWLRHGDPLAGRTARGLLPAFVDSVVSGTAAVESNGCILWPYGLEAHGYPTMREGGRTRFVAAVVLERVVGMRPTPLHTAGHASHDICGRRDCVAPAHLSWQTRAEQIKHQIDDGTFMYRTYTSSEVTRTVALVESGLSIRAAAREVGASHSTVRRWLAERPRTQQTSPSTRTA